MKNIVKQFYEDPITGLVRPELLQDVIEEETGKRLKPEQIAKKLEGVDAYTLNKQALKNFQRRRVYAGGIDVQWQIDLADLSRLSKENKGFKYLLTVIDVLSKYAWAVPLKTKTGPEVRAALDKIFASGRIPKIIQSDDGKEFYNSRVQELFKKHNITHFSTNNETKASIVERFNRTLKGRMYKYFDVTQSFRYIDVLDDLLEGYNNSYHRSIKMKPSEVNQDNEHQVLSSLYSDDVHMDRQPKLKVGDHVRISGVKHIFGKSFEGEWSIEVFKISEVLNTQPPTYKIVDLMGEDVIGSFYEEELQRVAKPETFRIEKIIRRRKNGSEVLVKWLGYPDKFNQWIPAEDVIHSDI
eukprot:Lithocolla_globosa_v1_NODE_591_length_3661_cov_41.346644.p1 type:complete len:354 gc:universal NODE_591_length_3661_cov_41.346644:876-1937(+)